MVPVCVYSNIDGIPPGFDNRVKDVVTLNRGAVPSILTQMRTLVFTFGFFR